MRAVVIIIMLIVAAGVSYSACQEFSSPGAYSLTGDTYGANISISPLGGAFFTCIKISSSDVVLDCNGFLIDSNLTSSQRYGILVIGATNSTVLTNVTIRNCPRVSRFGYPIYARNVTGLRVENATIFNTTTSGSYGIALINCSNGNIVGNNISNIQSAGTGVQQAGIFLNAGSHNNNISNNVIFNINGTGSSSRYGIESNFVTPVAGNFNNTIYNNTIWNVLGAPVYGTNSSGMVVRNNNLYGSTGPGISLDRSENTTIAENNVYNITQDCSRFDICRNATIANNTISVCGARGILTQQMTYSNIINNSISNSSTGIEMSETNYTILRNNTLHGGTSHGIFMSSRSYYDQITNNTIQNYSSHGIYLIGASSVSLFYQSIIANNTISNNTGHGVFFGSYIAYSNVFNNTISGNGQDGVSATMSNLVNVTQCRIYNNGGRGVSLSGYSASDIAIINQTYLSNNSGLAIVFEGLQFANLRLANAIIDSPAGGLTDFANLSLNDSLSSFSSYSFNWTGTPPSPPFTAFGKFVNISILGGTVVLDAIAWHWLDSESSGYQETNFTIYKYNSSGWSKVPASIDIGGNVLRATSVSPLSDFGILEGNESVNCPVISGPGSFVQDMDYSGAPNSGSPVLDGTCVLISSSNVTWDCGGRSIRNNGTSGATSAILLAGQITNVTLKNCPDLSNYSYGVFAYRLNASTISNMSISNNSNAAIRLVNTTYVNASSISAANNSFNSTSLGTIHLHNSSLGVFTGNTLSAGSNGFVLDLASNNNLLRDNIVYGNLRAGILLNNLTTYITGTNLSNNTVFNNTGYGVNAWDSNRTFLSRDRFFNNGVDLYVNHTSTQRVYNLSYVIFDNPSGSLANYTNISINDTSTTTNNRYTLNWSAEPAALPAGNVSFAGKYLALSRQTGVLDFVAWHWLDAELNGSNNESRFLLTRYTGSWSTPLNSTPDISANTLSLTNHNAAGVYAILENVSEPPVVTCPAPITAPGSYSLTENASGASNDISEILWSGYACVKINSSDVVFDCNGYNITNDGSAGYWAVGVALSGPVSNVTLVNCPNISSYLYGIYSYGASESSFGNITLHNSTNTGFILENTNESAVDSINLTDNEIGIVLTESSGNSLSTLLFDGCDYGLEIYSDSNGNNVTGCEFYGDAGADDSIQLGDVSGNYLRDIVIMTPSEIGLDGIVYTWGVVDSVIDNLTIAENAGVGIGYYGTSGLAVRNSLINSSTWGVFMSTAENNSFTDTVISNSSVAGADIDGSSGINFTNTTIYGSAGEGLYLFESNISVDGCRFYSNSPDFLGEGVSSSGQLTMADTVFDNPSGSMENFTTLSINDSIEAGEAYVIFWSENVSALPDNYTSFNNKFVNITPVSGSPSIESVVWSWDDSELGPHDESNLIIARFNGAWSDMGATLDAGANTLSLSGLASFSQFGPLENVTNETNVTGQNITLYGVNVTNYTLPRWEGSAFAGNFSTAPSNLTYANISASMLTDRWAAFYGNVSDWDIVLADAAYSLVYSWTWDPANDSIICVSTNSSVGTFEAFPGLAGDVDSAWGFSPSSSDSAANTFTGDNCTLTAGGVGISGCEYADTGYPGDFQTCLLKMSASPPKDGLLFCTMTGDDITLWNDETGDFELLVPTPYAPGPSGFETYYFYMASAG